MKTIKIFTLCITMVLFFTTGNVHAQKRRTTRTVVSDKYIVHTVTKDRVVYKSPRPKPVVVNKINHKTVVSHNGTRYYFDNHRFYSYSKGKYIVIKPKPGFRLKGLPAGYVKVVHQGRDYFFLDGIFFKYRNKVYEVIDPLPGMIVGVLPSAKTRVEIDGLVYYEFGDVLYKRIRHNGNRVYVVAGRIS